MTAPTALARKAHASIATFHRARSPMSPSVPEHPDLCLERGDWDDDVAEPEPTTVTLFGGARCHHCGERIVDCGVMWLHTETGEEACGG